MATRLELQATQDLGHKLGETRIFHNSRQKDLLVTIPVTFPER
jgi:hypothetical protein